MARSKGCIFRWSGTPSADWDSWYPMTRKGEDEILGFPICEQCGIAVDCLRVDDRISDEQMQKDLESLRDWVLQYTKHGHHHLPNGQLAPGQEPT